MQLFGSPVVMNSVYVAERADGTTREADETIINEDIMPATWTLNSNLWCLKPPAKKQLPRILEALATQRAKGEIGRPYQ